MPVRLTEAYLRKVIKEEIKKSLKEMQMSADYDPQVDDKLYDFLDNEARVGGKYPVAKLASMFGTTPAKIIAAFNEGGDMFRPYEDWCELEGDVIHKFEDSEAA